jgi:type II pantothenate kinase
VLVHASQVSPELAAAAADADLVVFEGMGRGIETNLKASFRCVFALCSRLQGVGFRTPRARLLPPRPAHALAHYSFCSFNSRCDSLKLGMIKHPEVAACLPGGRLYDCVCKLDLAGDDAAALRLPRAGLVQRDGGADLN